MPRRKEVLATGEIYHVYNRALDGREVFVGDWLPKRAVKALWFFRYPDREVSFSRYLTLTRKGRQLVEARLHTVEVGIEVVAYCLMRNHYHLLVRQMIDGALSKYVADIQNCVTRHFNIREGRKGALFESQFKVKRIENEDQLMHVSRYIHANPYVGYLVPNFDALREYQYSSLPAYLDRVDDAEWLMSDLVLENFQERGAYWVFLRDEAAYRRSVKQYRHLWLEREGWFE